MSVSPKPDGFARAMKMVLQYEGGNSDNAKDPGGRTRQGVTQRVYDAYRKNHGMPKQDVYKMSDIERDSIYKSQYWQAIQGDKLPAGVGFVVFDGAVNSGPKQSIKWLQRALNVDADGVMGAVTFAALDADKNHAALVDRIIDRREAFLKSLKTFSTFGNGWMARTTSVRKTGRTWAKGGDNPTVIPVTAAPPETQPKAVISDAKTPPPVGVGDAATGAGVTSGGAAWGLDQIKDQLSPFSSVSDWVGKIIVALIIISAVLTVGGLAYRWWSKRKQAKLADRLDTPTAGAQP